MKIINILKINISIPEIKKLHINIIQVLDVIQSHKLQIHKIFVLETNKMLEVQNQFQIHFYRGQKIGNQKVMRNQKVVWLVNLLSSSSLVR